MHPDIYKADRLPARQNIVFLVNDLKKIPGGYLSDDEMKFIQDKKKALKKEMFCFNRLSHRIFVQFIKEEKDEFIRLENCRKAGDEIVSVLNSQKLTEIIIDDVEGLVPEALALAEGIVLGNYQFLKYKKKNGKQNTLAKIGVFSKKIGTGQIEDLSIITAAVYRCRTFINEPHSHLNTPVFAKELEELAAQSGLKIEVMNKKKIETLKMGGILAVNKASNEPPVFIVMEWNPAGAVNKKPYVFVGKGIVYDSGGMNLKPGDFAENLTTQGIDIPHLPVGTRLRLGPEVELEVTQIGKACHHGCAIKQAVGDCVMPREGIFARVLRGGIIHHNDIIEVLDGPGRDSDLQR